ncbi:hypothetical protein AB0G15_41915 [Streptosporangium sp. NPDC023825]|uniref:hypothetical protein n=1 Tax=Streptosporangium sp. NPDC023825 TaxID=3154909 RepID=UPI0034235CA9
MAGHEACDRPRQSAGEAIEEFRRRGGDVVPKPRNPARGDTDGNEAAIPGIVVSVPHNF